jgi:hypothetical protein
MLESANIGRIAEYRECEMKEYVFVLRVDCSPCDDDEISDAVFEIGETYISWSGNETRITAYRDNEDPEQAGRQLLVDVARLGITIHRFELQLWSIAQIASAFDLSRETARLWARGRRRKDFPEPLETLGSQRAWSARHVYEWALPLGLWPETEFVPVPLEILEMLNGELAKQRLAAGVASVEKVPTP